jgi:hypothetical protein
VKHSLVELRHALSWLEDQALTDPTRALAVSILADLVAAELDCYYDTAQRASDLSVNAGVASLGLASVLGGDQ